MRKSGRTGSSRSDRPGSSFASAGEQFRLGRTVYSACGAAERCHFVEGPEGHRFYADLAWPVMLKELSRL